MGDPDIEQAVIRFHEAKVRCEAELQEKEREAERAREAAQKCGSEAGRRWLCELASYPQFVKLGESRTKPATLKSNPQSQLDITDEVWALLTAGEHDQSIVRAAFADAACQAWEEIHRQLIELEARRRPTRTSSARRAMSNAASN